MDIITLDFETRYDSRGYSLSKMSTEAYVRDERFTVFGCGIKINDKPATWVSGHDEVELALTSLDIPNNAILAHHAQFDGFILSHHFGLQPKVWFDTLSMARATVGMYAGGNSLDKLSKFFEVGVKGKELLNLNGVITPTKQQLRELGEYCKNDVEMTYAIFNKMLEGFPKAELKVIDKVVRMFTEPSLVMDYPLLKSYLEEVQANKMTLLLQAGVSQDELMSNNKFAELLERYHVPIPYKTSPTTGKATFAFAKTDPAMKALLEHEDENVQALVAARMGVKSTIAETRAKAFMEMSERGKAPVYLKYSGAEQTHRLSGGDKVNWQNLGRGSKLRQAVKAPRGHKLVAVDSSNIEARVLDYLADQQEVLEVFRKNDRGEGDDVYCYMASKIYGRHVTAADKPERQTGKIAVLGLGYGMGKDKFLTTAALFNQILDPVEAANIVNVYRNSHSKVVDLWRKADTALQFVNASSKPYKVDKRGIVTAVKGALVLPNGLKIRYPNLAHTVDGYEFDAGRGATKVYGGKVVENITQALARNIVMEQSMTLAKRWKWVLSVHDEAVFCVPEGAVEDCIADCIEVFRKAPDWAADLPLNCTAESGYNYHDCK